MPARSALVLVAFDEEEIRFAKTCILQILPIGEARALIFGDVFESSCPAGNIDQVDAIADESLCAVQLDFAWPGLVTFVRTRS